MSCLLLTYHASRLFVLLNKASDLLTRVARNLAQELAYQTFILSLERAIAEVFEGLFNPSVALICVLLESRHPVQTHFILEEANAC